MDDKEAREIAVHDTEHDICLSAGAGSGKTTVLIDRLIHLLTKCQVDLREIVAITFTEKAAAELKTRLSGALRKRGGDRPSGGTPWQYDLTQAWIGTIHSFCGLLLRENALEAGLDPAFEVLDEVKREALCRWTVEGWIDGMLTAAEQGQGKLAPLLERMELKRIRAMLEGLIVEPLKFSTLADRYAGDSAPEESTEHRWVREALMDAAGDLMARWNTVQAEQGKVNFDGLLSHARDLLRDHPQIRARYQGQFRYVHIDEFQDVDGVQADLIRLLCGFEKGEIECPPRLFIVGDPQQSIYRFRGADVDQFAQMRQAIERRDGLSLNLTRCFRSQARLVGFFNHAFSQVFVPPEGLPEERQIPYIPLTTVRPADPSAPAVEFLFLPTDLKVGQARAMEADTLARRLRQMIDDREQVIGERQADGTEKRREIRPGDIALLFRAMTDVQIYEKALRDYSIPFYTVAGSGFFEKQEVMDVLNALRLLSRPHDRLALVSVLRSPWVGCSDGTLYWIAAEGAWEDLRSEAFRQRIGPEEAARLDGFLSWFEDLRRQRDRLSIADLLTDLLHRTFYRTALTVQPDGRQALANLRKLLDLARQLDSLPGSTLHDFVAHFEERQEYTSREAESALEVEEGDTVKLMSVHKAKGLEWPVVVVVDLGRGFLKPTEDLLCDPDVGIGMKLRDARLEMKAGPDYEKVKAGIVRLDAVEQQRLLYVAATRVRDRLILSGAFNSEKFQPALGGDSSWLQWIRAVYPLTGEPVAYSDDGQEMPIRVDLPPVVELSAPLRGMAWPELTQKIRDTASQAVPDETAWLAQLPLPPLDGLPGRVAVTELELFETCPRRYQLRRLLQLPEDRGPSPLSEAEEEVGERTPALSVGALVHAALQQLPADATPDRLPGILQTIIQRWDEDAVEIGSDAEGAAVRLLEGWLKSGRWAEIRESPERQHEVPFTLRMADGFCLIGRFDLLYRDASGRWYVLDYKTDRLDGLASAHVEAYYALQQRAYGLAAARLLGKKFAGVTFTFLRNGEDVCWEPSREALLETEAHLHTAIDSWSGALRSGAFPRTGDPARCIRCGYRTLCER